MEDAHLGHPLPIFVHQKKKKKKEEFYFYHALTQRKIRRGCHWYDLGAAAVVARVANMTSACIWQVWDEREAKS